MTTMQQCSVLYGKDYDSFADNLAEAKAACIADENCGAVHNWCGDSNSAAQLCLKNTATESTLGGCVFTKPEGMWFAFKSRYKIH